MTLSPSLPLTDDVAARAEAAWTGVLGQDRAVETLRRSLAGPAHAYLFLGQAGSGAREAARVFAAHLVTGGADDPDRAMDLALRGHHPDVHVVARQGPFITMEQARGITEEANRSPVEGTRKVFVLEEFHLLQEAAPALLKTIEEPPPGRHFIVLAEEIPPELVTIASRCLTIEFGPVPAPAIAARLVEEGHDPAAAEFAAGVADGDLDRARVLVTDPALRARYELWWGLPDRLDGSGAAAVAAAEAVTAALDEVLAPVQARHEAERAELDEQVEMFGTAGGTRTRLTERHKRELRRHRVDEWRFGYGVLSARYRDALEGAENPRPLLLGLKALADTGEALTHNPNEALLLESVLLRLPPLR